MNTKLAETTATDTEAGSCTQARARAVAAKAGLRATKSRRGVSLDNLGRFILTDPNGNWIAAGSRFELDAADVLAFCAPEGEGTP